MMNKLIINYIIMKLLYQNAIKDVDDNLTKIFIEDIKKYYYIINHIDTNWYLEEKKLRSNHVKTLILVSIVNMVLNGIEVEEIYTLKSIIEKLEANEEFTNKTKNFSKIYGLAFNRINYLTWGIWKKFYVSSGKHLLLSDDIKTIKSKELYLNKKYTNKTPLPDDVIKDIINTILESSIFKSNGDKVWADATMIVLKCKELISSKNIARKSDELDIAIKVINSWLSNSDNIEIQPRHIVQKDKKIKVYTIIVDLGDHIFKKISGLTKPNMEISTTNWKHIKTRKKIDYGFIPSRQGEKWMYKTLYSKEAYKNMIFFNDMPLKINSINMGGILNNPKTEMTGKPSFVNQFDDEYYDDFLNRPKFDQTTITLIDAIWLHSSNSTFYLTSFKDARGRLYTESSISPSENKISRHIISFKNKIGLPEDNDIHNWHLLLKYYHQTMEQKNIDIHEKNNDGLLEQLKLMNTTCEIDATASVLQMICVIYKNIDLIKLLNFHNNSYHIDPYRAIFNKDIDPKKFIDKYIIDNIKNNENKTLKLLVRGDYNIEKIKENIKNRNLQKNTIMTYIYSSKPFNIAIKNSNIAKNNSNWCEIFISTIIIIKSFEEIIENDLIITEALNIINEHWIKTKKTALNFQNKFCIMKNWYRKKENKRKQITTKDKKIQITIPTFTDETDFKKARMAITPNLMHQADAYIVESIRSEFRERKYKNLITIHDAFIIPIGLIHILHKSYLKAINELLTDKELLKIFNLREIDNIKGEERMTIEHAKRVLNERMERIEKEDIKMISNHLLKGEWW